MRPASAVRDAEHFFERKAETEGVADPFPQRLLLRRSSREVPKTFSAAFSSIIPFPGVWSATPVVSGPALGRSIKGRCRFTAPSSATRLRGQCQMGSLTGAVHPSKDNAGVPRPAQRGQKPRVEHKGKCRLDPDFQWEYGPRKRGLTILLTLLSSFEQEVSEKLPQG